jgi:hypothetical protein
MVISKSEKYKYAIETISEKLKKSEKKLTFSYFFGRYGVKPPTA